MLGSIILEETHTTKYLVHLQNHVYAFIQLGSGIETRSVTIAYSDGILKFQTMLMLLLPLNGYAA